MNYTQSIGNVVELQCIAKFIELGYEVSIPYGNGAKYDFVADVEGKFVRIQCKSSSNPKKNGIVDTEAFHFSTVCTTTNTQKTSRYMYTSDQIDYFATIWNDKVYLIPVDECSTSKTLRLSPPKNNSPIYNKAEDYDIETVIGYSKDLISSKKLFEERQKDQSSVIKQYFCKNCGKLLSGKTISGVCSKCNSIQSRIVERPSRDELKMLIRTLPFTQIASSYGVTDNAIRKWCDAEGLPRKVSEIKQYSEEDWKSI